MKQLDLRSSILKKAIRLTPLFLLLAVNRCLAAAWEGTDDFSSGISAVKWDIYQQYVGQMTVAGANGHASFLVPVSSTSEQNAFIVWRGNPTAAEDWLAEIRGHNTAFHPSCAFQFAVVDAKAWISSGAVNAFQVGMKNDLNVGLVGTSWWHFPGGYTDRIRVGTTSTDFKLRLVYHASNKTIEAWHDPTAAGQGWIKLDSMTLNEMSPGMTTTDPFAFAILANTDYGPILEEEIWADDFLIRIIPPRLFVTSAQWSAGTQQLSLMWTNPGAKCVLESAGALPGVWSTVSTPWTTNAGWVSTTVTNSSAAQFYRLRAN